MAIGDGLIALVVASVVPPVAWFMLMFFRFPFPPRLRSSFFRIAGFTLFIVVPFAIGLELVGGLAVATVIDPETLLFALVGACIIAPVAEELLKASAVWFGGDRGMIQEPLDGIVLAVAAGLAFASVENFKYFITYYDGVSLPYDVIILRSLFCIPLHAMTLYLYGFALGRQRLPGARKSVAPLVVGLVVAIAIHAASNLNAVLNEGYELYPAVVWMVIEAIFLYLIWRQVKASIIQALNERAFVPPPPVWIPGPAPVSYPQTPTQTYPMPTTPVAPPMPYAPVTPARAPAVLVSGLPYDLEPPSPTAPAPARPVSVTAPAYTPASSVASLPYDLPFIKPKPVTGPVPVRPADADGEQLGWLVEILREREHSSPSP